MQLVRFDTVNAGLFALKASMRLVCFDTINAGLFALKASMLMVCIEIANAGLFALKASMQIGSHRHRQRRFVCILSIRAVGLH